MSDKIKQLLDSMSLEEKIAQLQSVPFKKLIVDGKLSIEKCKELVPHGVGHVGQYASNTALHPNELVEAVNAFEQYIKETTEHPIAPLFHDEAITGIAAAEATVTPQMIGMSCSWNPSLVYENAVMTAENMKKIKAYYALSPMMDLINDARWGRGEEGYGEDPYLISQFALNFIKGLEENGIAATAKHYAGYGEENQDIVYFRNNVLTPFEVSVKHGNVSAVMPGYHAFHDVPCSASKFLLTDVLRGDFKFDGLISSDYGAVENIKDSFHYVETYKEAGVLSISAGMDVDLNDGKAFSFLPEAVREGSLSEEVIDKAVYRVLKLKDRLGRLYIKDEEKIDAPICMDPPENRARALESARHAVVMIKNNGILPYDFKNKKVAVVGPNAHSYYSLLGDYTAMGVGEFFCHNPAYEYNPELVTLYDGLKNKVGKDADVRFERGCDWTDYFSAEGNKDASGDARAKTAQRVPLEKIPETNPYKALDLAKDSDIIIAGIGENRYLCGEVRNREEVSLHAVQEEFVNQLCDTGKPVVLVVFGGRPLAITELAKRCAAVIYAWYPGEEGGTALAEILSGETNPSGKLTVTLPDHPMDVPTFYRKERVGAPSVYPFGFGLSYTTYEYSDFEIDENVAIDAPYADIKFSITNTGDRSGIETAQVYVKYEENGKTLRKLIGYSQVELKAGETKKTGIRVYPDYFAEYDAEGKLTLSPKNFDVQIGASSADIKYEAKLILSGEARTIDEKHYFADQL